MNEPVTVTMKFDRETKRSRRYVEDGEEWQHKIGTLYMPIATLASMGDRNAEKLTVTISLA